MKNILCLFLVLVISINIFSLEISKRNAVKSRKGESISDEQAFLEDASGDPAKNAVTMADADFNPLKYLISGCVTSCMVSAYTTTMFSITFYTPTLIYYGYVTSIVGCLVSTIESYTKTPKVPDSYLLNKDNEYINIYKRNYKNRMKWKNALFSFIGGTAGVLLTVFIYYFLSNYTISISV